MKTVFADSDRQTRVWWFLAEAPKSVRGHLPILAASFDHGLNAAVLATVAVGAHRRARRADVVLAERRQRRPPHQATPVTAEFLSDIVDATGVLTPLLWDGWASAGREMALSAARDQLVGQAGRARPGSSGGEAVITVW
ncbi:hypothetical protein [Actinomadura terrae]|uniref:hypothetical protein n=1 Tax=Actinomadura terrae TaxID=604353 RepID=UPI001FA75C6D|nr:hypothetical protein [Actinomadura terrae]